ncbi:MAG: MBL fold metallo-hydrolase [Clostridia bacterium]
MKISNNVHLIRKEFFVTPFVKRYVNIYLITGKFCYLIDSGVCGTETLIEEYMKTVGRKMTDIKAIFLTHSHPDHIGAAFEIKRLTHCEIYAPSHELNWIEDIDAQFSQRPIPNFYNLVPKSVKVNHPLTNGDTLLLEEGIKIKALSTKGHSHGSMSYILNDEVIFTGDAIPVSGDLPIFVDYEETLKSIHLIQNIPNIKYYCPAWDDVCSKDMLDGEIVNTKAMLLRLKNAVIQTEKEFPALSKEEKIREICKRADMIDFSRNPLFIKSIEACSK